MIWSSDALRPHWSVAVRVKVTVFTAEQFVGVFTTLLILCVMVGAPHCAVGLACARRSPGSLVALHSTNSSGPETIVGKVELRTVHFSLHIRVLAVSGFPELSLGTAE
jgi:hypothetical protein